MNTINKITLGILFACSLYSQISYAMEQEEIPAECSSSRGLSEVEGVETGNDKEGIGTSPHLPYEMVVKIATHLDNPSDLYSYSLINPNFNECLKLIDRLNLNLTQEDNRPKLNLLTLANLTHLSVYYTNGEYADYLKSMNCLGSLREISFKAACELTAPLIRAINSLTNLTSLNLEKCFEKVDWSEFHKSGNISNLSLHSNISYLGLPCPIYPQSQNTHSAWLAYNTALLKNIARNTHNKKLETLKIYSKSWDENFVRRLQQFHNLQELHVFIDYPLSIGPFKKTWEKNNMTNSQIKIFGLNIDEQRTNGETVASILNNSATN
jgi:hypothetical protein